MYYIYYIYVYIYCIYATIYLVFIANTSIYIVLGYTIYIVFIAIFNDEYLCIYLYIYLSIYLSIYDWNLSIHYLLLVLGQKMSAIRLLEKNKILDVYCNI